MTGGDDDYGAAFKKAALAVAIRHARSNMPFRFGQVFECTENGQTRQAIVLRIRREGQEGLLRFIDTRVEEWVQVTDFPLAWKRKGQ